MSTHQTTNVESAPDMSVDDQYYNKEEYKKLTAAQKHGLKIKRSKRGHKPSPKKKQHNSKFKLTARQIKAVISQLKENNDDNLTINETEENNKENHEQTTNCNNKALQRNKWNNKDVTVADQNYKKNWELHQLYQWELLE